VKEFKDKVAVVTGAASGIGRALAGRCVQEGMKVVVADIEEPPLVETANALRSKGGKVLAVVTDVSKSGDVEDLARKTLSAFGGVHLLCNNAGVTGGTWTWKNTMDDWEWVIGVNLWGVIHGIRVFVPIMLEEGTDCHIVNTASIAGLVSYTGSSIYGATKHAVVSLSETLYLELEQIGAKVKVSVLCPGGVRTRIGEAERNRPMMLPRQQETEAGPNEGELAGRFWERVMGKEALPPEQVAGSVFSAIREERFHILTHPQYNNMIQRRVDDMLQGRNPTNAMSLLAP
jgi:NAD(P)-dependent dehydrogenase (short-subunit alcohol dehydrogenase family)